jgi:hypothetical protein
MSRSGLTIALMVFSTISLQSALADQSPWCASERPWTCAAPLTPVQSAHPVIRPKRIFGISRNDLVPELAAKVGEIITTCGAHLVSAFRPHAVVAGTHRASLHSYYPSRAADVAGHPSCIYALLRGWPGGFSVDYARVKHVHLSYDPHGREWGSRFVHGGHYAHHHHHRKAA